MKYYGTKNNKDYGFYEENFENAIAISDKDWEKLLNEQSDGKRIILYKDKIIAVNEEEYVFENDVWRELSGQEIIERQQQKQKASKTAELEKQLTELDKKRIRAIAEPSMKDNEITWLEYYNRQVQDVRNQLKNL